MRDQTQKLIGQIDALLATLPPVKESWSSSTMEGWFKDTVGYERAITQAISLIRHIYGDGHPNFQRLISFVNRASLHSLRQIEGLLNGAKQDLMDGLVENLANRIELDIKSDFLDSALALANEGLKDPAAVLACIVLEDSLKRLASRHQIAIAADKEMSVVAQLLLSSNIIEKSTNQAIQSFRNLRIAALHAQWAEVSMESVRLLLAFLPTFLEKHSL